MADKTSKEASPLTAYPPGPQAYRADDKDGFGFPKGPPNQDMPENDIVLKPFNHFRETLGDSMPYNENQKYLFLPQHHFTVDNANQYLTKVSRNYYKTSNGTDTPTQTYYNRQIPYTFEQPELKGQSDPRAIPVFSGSTTSVNPLDSKTINDILENGLESETQKKYESDLGYKQPPLSPVQPFTRMDPYLARRQNINTYNRFKLPVADLEFRKGFHHIFFTRPECYVMYGSDNKVALCQQTESDSIFSTAYERYPYLIEMLAPVYVTGPCGCGYEQNAQEIINHNWNYLLSNRVIKIDTTPSFELENGAEDFTKSHNGFSIAMGKASSSVKGGEISITFRETKYLEVYEFLRMWMWYIHKRYLGTFAPSYNNYQYENKFVTSQSKYNLHLHPYSRAMDYCASIFDCFTDETMSKIIHWTKWYGVYPISATLNGVDYNGKATVAGDDGITVTATFYYQAKFQNLTKSLVEFNYNTGIVNDTGDITKVKREDLLEAGTYLVKEDAGLRTQEAFLDQYIGPTDMFVGPPYIVMDVSDYDVVQPDRERKVLGVYLKFMPLKKQEAVHDLNLHITNSYMNRLDVVGGNS